MIGAAVLLLASVLSVASPAAAVPGAGSTLFINELHYDNAGTDAGEFVEVAGPAGTDLSGWSIVLYNGSNGTSYNTLALSGTLADAGQGYGFAVVNLPVNGLQNGAPDGLALVDGAANVVQFLSYEGSLTATNGPAASQTSTDIGVSETSGTAVGDSLQLTGDGALAGDFSWTGPAASTAGAANTGQTFSGGEVTPVLNEFSVNTAGTDVEYIEVAGAPNTDYTSYSVLEIQGIVEGADTPGQVIDVHAVGTTDGAGLTVNNLPANTVENDPITLLLVEGFSGSIGDDLDPGDDGTFDTTPWTAIVDSVSISDGSVDYSSTVLDEAFDDAVYSGASAAFAPGGASRLPDRVGGWFRNDFDLAPIQAGSPEDGEALNTPGAPNEAAEPIDPPSDPVKIHEVQGSGPTIAITGEVTIEAVVTSLFQDNDTLDGFFVQEEDAETDGDPATSEGIFVFCRGACLATVAVGDIVGVTGEAEEFFGMSQIDTTAGGTITVVSSGNPLPAATPLSLPAPGRTDDAATFESTEAMIVSFADTLVVSEYFELARYGQVVLTDEARPEQFTDTNLPDAAGYAAFLDDLATRRIILDDDDNDQNDATTSPDDNEVYPYPVGGLSTTNFFRGGDTIAGLTGVMHWSFAGQSGTDAWRIRQVPGESYDFTPANPRTAAPAPVGGSVTVASFNVLNYFTTLDEPGATCGPSALGCRGAHSAAELARQRDKIVAAIAAIDADVVGLIEIENDAGASVADLVAGLNAAVGAGTYDYVDTGTIGGDAIKVAFIYKPATISPVGPFAVLDSSVDPTFIDTKNRPVLIQTFEQPDGARFTAAVNHLKSKGSACDDVGDPDLGDGQANCAGTRTAAAEALANYLATDPTGSGDPDFLIIGDLNAYAMEDPITALEGSGYVDLVESFVGSDAYSFVFDGQLGYLDHAMANGALEPQVTGVTTWNINADEVNLLDYNDDIRDAAEASFEVKSNATDIYDPDQYRSSDHDPVIIGLDLQGGEEILSCAGVEATRTQLIAAGFNVLIGSDRRDVIHGTSGPDFILGLAGRDWIDGRGGDDVICGGNGADDINGSRGDDRIDGGAGRDQLSGGRGADVISGGNGRDTIAGGAGADELNGGNGNDDMRGNGGDDTLRGERGDDNLKGNGGTDICDGGPETTADVAANSCETIIDVP